ncbi:nicotinamide riboside transporter PnuC [Arcticibacterium luteifluviistationis]|uniref:Nicotinamide riboside transporter PnuC n=1 Tax=Arcticibacterium luteifluviistationis TaxID=1784714 RepID=A0A2Z4G9A8_9BACT|nr:nicotinamide riboside transporter PnuC [Arcticibacterium luteifluviistationis]AWV97802.1 nicotinamide riboside transporter PnuC [Arcticibacterium luteifluviistationis]
MQNLLDVNNTLFTVLGYDMSLIELVATISGGIAVWLSTKENVWSWIIGLINVVLAFFMFFQIQLYPDMFLQIFFFITNIIGFWQWKFPKASEANAINQLKITKLSVRNFALLSALGVVGTLIMGTFSSNLHEIAPKVFSIPSAFPYMDSFTTVMSIVATFMLIRKKVEAWWIWLVVDIIATYMYYIKDVKLYSLLYFVFVIIAAFGAMEWTKRYLKQQEA